VQGGISEVPHKVCSGAQIDAKLLPLSVDDGKVRRWDTYLRRVAGLEQVYKDRDLILYTKPPNRLIARFSPPPVARALDSLWEETSVFVRVDLTGTVVGLVRIPAVDDLGFR